MDPVLLRGASSDVYRCAARVAWRLRGGNARLCGHVHGFNFRDSGGQRRLRVPAIPGHAENTAMGDGSGINRAARFSGERGSDAPERQNPLLAGTVSGAKVSGDSNRARGIGCLARARNRFRDCLSGYPASVSGPHSGVALALPWRVALRIRYRTDSRGKVFSGGQRLDSVCSGSFLFPDLRMRGKG